MIKIYHIHALNCKKVKEFRNSYKNQISVHVNYNLFLLRKKETTQTFPTPGYTIRYGYLKEL